MTYFNGTHPSLPTENVRGEPISRKPMTRIYCDACAEAAIPLPPAGPLTSDPMVGRHWNTEFIWCPYYGGDAKCQVCNEPC
jgi:hypothetical protein